ncbi:MAG: hypothetical protein Q7R53_01870, partial [bacterium]|nr:hypothetical protein [bacterium]
MIDLSDLNPNLSQETLSSQAQRLVSSNQRRTLIPARIENFVRKFEKVAFVDYSQFIKKEQLKTVFVTDAVNVSMFYDDKSVGFGEEFEYYISSVSSNFEETFQSDTIRVLVQDNRGISVPDIFTKQIDVNSILVQISYKSEEQIDNVFLYRREEDNDVAFIKVAEFFDVQKDTVEFLDKKTFFGKQFIYRAITENLHGVVSAPAEITVSSLTNIEKSRANNLKKPVFNAVQQKNVATLTISPNDSRVLFYIVDRRDLSIYESSFVVPNRDTNGYGGNGWASNQLFYDRLNPQSIIFADNTVLGDHIYQYRIIGVDRFGNKTSCSYQTIEILKNEMLKPPTNLQIFILREFPMRIKIKWDDENVYDEGVVPFFEIQRRQGHNSFASFPLTKNQFIVDEIYSDDFVQFSANKTEDVYTQLIPNTNVATSISRASVIPNLAISSGERAPIAPILIPDANTRPAKITSRSSGVLDFLKENFIYFYRIKVITPMGSFSPYSKEAKVITIQPLASPVRFAVHIVNPKVKPAVVQLSWQIEEGKSIPDHFVIERKVDNVNDVFRVIGKAYFQNKFF